MANRKITFSFPEELAVRFVKTVPSSRRSRYVAELIESKLRERDRMLIEACEAANNDPETRAIQREMDALPNTMTAEEQAALRKSADSVKELCTVIGMQ